jgi:hypothetical protein
MAFLFGNGQPPPGFEQQPQHHHNPSPPLNHHARLQRPHSESSPPASDFLSMVSQPGATTAVAAAVSAPAMGPVDPLGFDPRLLQEFRESDRRREELLLALVRRNQELTALYQQKCNDYDQERKSLAMWQRNSNSLESQLTALKLSTVSLHDRA